MCYAEPANKYKINLMFLSISIPSYLEADISSILCSSLVCPVGWDTLDCRHNTVIIAICDILKHVVRVVLCCLESRQLQKKTPYKLISEEIKIRTFFRYSQEIMFKSKQKLAEYTAVDWIIYVRVLQ